MIVLVPKKLQSRVLEMLHEGHMGIVKVKQLAHSYVYMVAVHWQGNWKVNQVLQKLSARLKNAHISPSTPLDLAIPTLG